MRFTKMHGAGNDYIFLNGFKAGLPEDLRNLARRISNRRLGVGGDGLIVLEPDDSADFRMRIFNADGSEAEMCGNGLRCAFKYLHDRSLVSGDRGVARTGAGLLDVSIVRRTASADIIRVNMGPPQPGPGPDYIRCVTDDALRLPLRVEDRMFEVAFVSVGNPHIVLFLDEAVESFPVEHHGPLLEHHPVFPDRTNVDFVQYVGRNEVIQRTWERGSGETHACGTGACATLVAGSRIGRLESPTTVHFRGGDLTVTWQGGVHPVFLEGPAEEVYSGEWNG